jgi:hypothetical protein
MTMFRYSFDATIVVEADTEEEARNMAQSVSDRSWDNAYGDEYGYGGVHNHDQLIARERVDKEEPTR